MAPLLRPPVRPQRAGGIKIIDIYTRLSKAKDGRTISCAEQEEDGRAEIAEHHDEGWRVGEVFMDHAKSAWRKDVVRPDWDKQMARLESGAADGIWVLDLTRFTRKPKEGERLIDIAENGLIVVSAENTYNLQDPDSRAHFRQDMTSAAKESDKNSWRTRRGKEKKAKRGRSNAGPRGYAMEGREPKPDEWEQGDPLPPMVPMERIALERGVVQDIAKRHLSGESLDQIIVDYNSRGEEYWGLYGPWTQATMRQLLLRKSLAGFVTYKDEVIAGKMLPGEPVLDMDTWNALQALFAARKHGRPGSEYLLSGLIICADCIRSRKRDQLLYGRPNTSRSPYPDGEVAREYYCQPRAFEGGCGRMKIDRRVADEIITQATLARLSDPRFNEQLRRRHQVSSEQRRALSAREAELNAQVAQIAAKLGKPGWTLEAIDNAISANGVQLERVQAQLRELEDDVDGMFEPDTDEIRAAWESGTLDQKKAMIKRAFPRLMILQGSRFDSQVRRFVFGPKRWYVCEPDDYPEAI